MWKAAVGVCLMIAVGCAVPATGRILKASASIESAERAEADKYAVYELTKAREYLHKAREEYGYAEYELAAHYADEAAEAGDKALEKAREHPSDVPSAAPPPPPPGAVPSAPASIQVTPTGK